MNSDNKVSDQFVREHVIDPVGGVERFRLVVCPDFKLIQYFDDEGQFFDLILEDDNLAAATISLLERSGVLEISRGAG